MTEREIPTEERRVTLVGPTEHGDVLDLETGLRFLHGRSVGVPISVAQKVVDTRRGYYIEPYGGE
jgi:hypothetical protein